MVRQRAGTAPAAPARASARLATVAQQFTQGNITTTENPLDVAINGAGFFECRTPTAASLYTRNGQFKIDPNSGNITTTAGETLIGYGGATDGIPLAVAPADRRHGREHDHRDGHRGQPAGQRHRDRRRVAFDPTNVASYNNATSATVFDAQGNEVALTHYFRQDAANDGGRSTTRRPEGETVPQTFAELRQHRRHADHHAGDADGDGLQPAVHRRAVDRA